MFKLKLGNYENKVVILILIMFVLPHFAYSQKKKTKNQGIYASTEFDYMRTAQYFKFYLFYNFSVGYYSKKNWINEIQLEFNKGTTYGIGFGMDVSKYIHPRISVFSSVDYISDGLFDYAVIPDNLFNGGFSNFYKTEVFLINIGVSFKIYPYKKSGFNMDISTGYSTIFKNLKNQPHTENKSYIKPHITIGLKYKYYF